MGLCPLPGIDIAPLQVSDWGLSQRRCLFLSIHLDGVVGSQQTITKRMRGSTGRDGVISFPLLGGWYQKL